MRAYPFSVLSWTALIITLITAISWFVVRGLEGELLEIKTRFLDLSVGRIRWAADHGDANAQYRMGCAYSLGDRVKKDDKEAVRWYHMAAQQGHASAQERLGDAYLRGLGVRRNLRESIKWYRMAASQGNFCAKAVLKELRKH